jgi:Dolichyl-phosphate-mannose-protein mannosyltransferase
VTIASRKFIYWLLPLVLAAIAGLWLAHDGRHHWDEPTYLYEGLYLTPEQIIEGRIQPSGIGHFTQGRILHALFVKGVMTAAGDGPSGFHALVAINFLLIVASFVLMFHILRDLLPDLPERRGAAFLVAMSPVILYLLFKVLADNEALFAALVATYALLELARGGPKHLGLIAIAGLAIAALTKNQMVFLPATCWVALVAFPVARINRKRLVLYGVGCGLAAFILTLATLQFLGIALEAYLASYLGLMESNVPMIAKFVNVATELGALWLLLPFALLTPRRQELRAFGLWFLLAMAPFVFVIDSIEARHVAVNLVAVGGLLALAIEAIELRWRAWQRMTDGTRCAVAVAAVVVLMAANALTLKIMPHRVQLDQMQAMIGTLDARYGAGRYALLTSAGYTDFQLIRVLWPEVDARDVSTDTIVFRGHRTRAKALACYTRNRDLHSIEDLRALKRPLVYFGYRQTFAAENLRDILGRVSPRLATRLLGAITLVDRLHTEATAWLWNSPKVRLDPIAESGHYLAYEVKLSPAP